MAGHNFEISIAEAPRRSLQSADSAWSHANQLSPADSL